jgi:hypothetical protein
MAVYTGDHMSHPAAKVEGWPCALGRPPGPMLLLTHLSHFLAPAATLSGVPFATFRDSAPAPILPGLPDQAQPQPFPSIALCQERVSCAQFHPR